MVKFLSKLFVLSLWLLIWLGPQILVYDIDSSSGEYHFLAILLKAMVMLNVLFMGTPLLILLNRICPSLVHSISNLPNKFDSAKKIDDQTEVKKISVLPHGMRLAEPQMETILPTENWTPNEKICGIYCILNLVTKSIYLGHAIDVNFKSHYHFRLLAHKNHPNVSLQKEYNTFEDNVNSVYRVSMLMETNYVNYEETKSFILHQFKEKINELHHSDYIIHNYDDALFDVEEAQMISQFEIKEHKVVKHDFAAVDFIPKTMAMPMNFSESH